MIYKHFFAYIILSLSIFIQLYGLFFHPLRFDELIMFSWVYNNNLSTLLESLKLQEAQMPLSYLILKVFASLNIEKEWVIRIPSFLSILGCLYFYFKYVRINHSYSFSLYSVAYLSLSFPLIIYSNSIRPYSMILLFSIINLYLIEKLLKSSKKNWLFFILIINNIFLYYTHFISLIALVTCFFNRFNSHKSLKITIVALSISITAFVLNFADIFYKLQYFMNTYEYSSIFKEIEKIAFLFSGKEFFILFISSFFLSSSRHSIKDIFSKIWPYVFSSLLIFNLFLVDLFQARHFIFFIPFITYTFTKNIINIKRRYIRLTLAIISIVAMLYNILLFNSYISETYQIESRKIATQIPKDSKYSDHVYSCGNCIEYYYRNTSCFGKKGLKSFSPPDNHFVLIVFKANKNICDLNHLDFNYFKIADTVHLKGVSAYFFEPLNINSH